MLREIRPAILILLSFVHPVYTLRYVLYCLLAVIERLAVPWAYENRGVEIS